MNCVKCGVELKDGAKFCKNCGAPQSTLPRRCVKCGAELKAGARFCDCCGAPQQPGTVVPPVTATPPVAQVPPPVAQVPPPNLPPKKLVTYRMLSLFLGGLGIHNFYAGHTAKGIIQIVLGWTGISGIWALIDVFTVTTDGYGRPMEDTVPKNLTTYRLLALFLGGIGAHNFYAGYLGRGLAQILLCWTGISWLWALVEMFTVKNDANGNPMIVGEKAEKISRMIAVLSIGFAAPALLFGLYMVISAYIFFYFGVWLHYPPSLWPFILISFVLSVVLGILALIIGGFEKKGHVAALWSLLLVPAAVVLGIVPFRMYIQSIWIVPYLLFYGIWCGSLACGVVAVCRRCRVGIVGIMLSLPCVLLLPVILYMRFY